MLRSSGAIDVRSSHGNEELTWHRTWIVLDIKDYFASSFVLDQGKSLDSHDHKNDNHILRYHFLYSVSVGVLSF